MTTLKTLIVVTALLASGTSLVLAQNGPPTSGQLLWPAALPLLPRLQISLPVLRPELLIITGQSTTECT
jgi:hypothetical protein